MAIVFPNNTITEVGAGKISYPKKVIQIVDNPFTATLSVNNWSTQNEIATATITPTSTTSQILIYVNCHFRGDIADGSWSLGYFWVHNNTQNVALGRSGWNGTWRMVIYDWSKHFLHSPASTSAQTYSLRFGNYPSGTHVCNTSCAHDGISHIRLIEFAT
jgi:hypothetical protein